MKVPFILCGIVAQLNDGQESVINEELDIRGLYGPPWFGDEACDHTSLHGCITSCKDTYVCSDVFV